MSCTTGIVWTTSPSEESLTISTRKAVSNSMRRGRDLGVGLHFSQRGHELPFDAMQRLGRVALEAQHQHRRRVGRAHEAEAVFVFGAQPVDRDDLLRAV